VVDIVNDPSKSAPLLKVIDEDFKEHYILASAGVSTGKILHYGKKVTVKAGNMMFLGSVPEGTQVNNIEKTPGDGGKLVRATGDFGAIVSHDRQKKTTKIRLPSKKSIDINSNCRATIGAVAGAGRKEKPFLKAGNKFKAMKARNKLYPRTSASSMNAVDHPFGGRTKPGRSTSSPKHGSPGQKVGNIAPRRTGAKKHKKVD